MNTSATPDVQAIFRINKVTDSNGTFYVIVDSQGYIKMATSDAAAIARRLAELLEAK